MSDAAASLERTMATLVERARLRSVAFEAWVAALPQTKRCEAHGAERGLDVAASRELSSREGDLRSVYQPCAGCQAAKREAGVLEMLGEAGVPLNLLHCRVENWTARTAEDTKTIEDVNAFIKRRRGALMLVGHDKGVGKTHLAIATMVGYPAGMFITQERFLRELRNSYSTDRDFVGECTETPILVLDEIGLSVGGRDELPALHGVLNARCGDKLPTVLTSNLSKLEFGKALGERMADRLNECGTLRVLSGESHRRERRKEY